MLQIIPPNLNFPFMKFRRQAVVASAIVVALALILPFVLKPNWGTSFRGGTTMLVHFESEVPIEDVRTAFGKVGGFEDVAVQSVDAPAGKSGYMIKTAHTTTLNCDKLGTLHDKIPSQLATAGMAGATLESWPACSDEGVRGDFFIRFGQTPGLTPPNPDETATPDLDPLSGVSAAGLQSAFTALGLDASVAYEPVSRRFVVKPMGLQADVTKVLVAEFGPKFDPERGFDEVVTVGADVGEKFRNDGIVSLLFALGLIMIYVAVRFDMRYSPGGVVALLHDALITFGFVTLTRMEVTLETVAAILAIVGYSINDTIVIFDRIREITRSGGKDSLEEQANRAINQTMSRSVLTAGTTVLAMLPLCFVAQGVIRDFAIVMVFGIAVGTYSSIFIASPIMLWLDGFFSKRRARLEAQKQLEAASSKDDKGDEEPTEAKA